MSARFNQTSVNENFAELVRQRSGALRACRIWKDVSVRIVARWQRCQVIAERLHERQHDAPPSLARCERNLAGLEIDSAPSELCQVAEPLAEIQAEQHETAPLDIVARTLSGCA